MLLSLYKAEGHGMSKIFFIYFAGSLLVNGG